MHLQKVEPFQATHLLAGMQKIQLRVSEKDGSKLEVRLEETKDGPRERWRTVLAFKCNGEGEVVEIKFSLQLAEPAIFFPCQRLDRSRR